MCNIIVLFNPNFNQNYMIFSCGVILTHYSCICILVITTLKMAKWVAKICWWLQFNKIHSYVQVHLLVIIINLMHLINVWNNGSWTNLSFISWAVKEGMSILLNPHTLHPRIMFNIILTYIYTLPSGSSNKNLCEFPPPLMHATCPWFDCRNCIWWGTNATKGKICSSALYSYKLSVCAIHRMWETMFHTHKKRE
jgi:hypothetical protein